ncbi:MAG: hypothetical protein QOE36_994 [Gaiellaceae bacterium]|jgi:hypothetical protein|nr:hypothetical protein [Gaiellaceae bacterium]
MPLSGEYVATTHERRYRMGSVGAKEIPGLLREERRGTAD